MSLSSTLPMLVVFILGVTLMVYVDNASGAVARNYLRRDSQPVARGQSFPYNVPYGGSYLIHDGEQYPGYGHVDPCNRLASKAYYLGIPNYADYYYICRGREATVYHCQHGYYFSQQYNACVPSYGG